MGPNMSTYTHTSLSYLDLIYQLHSTSVTQGFPAGIIWCNSGASIRSFFLRMHQLHTRILSELIFQVHAHLLHKKNCFRIICVISVGLTVSARKIYRTISDFCYPIRTFRFDVGKSPDSYRICMSCVTSPYELHEITQLFLITVARSEFFRTNWVILSLQRVCVCVCKQNVAAINQRSTELAKAKYDPPMLLIAPVWNSAPNYF